MAKTIGSYEAKTHLPRLLDEVARGATFTITKNGRPVALLAPVDDRRKRMRELIDEIKGARKGVSLGGLSIRELIDEGRRF
ncbi:MAG TPA: type II toxin-antitoxin system prevent-host-death family antitoxin [Candidatus Tyrphobacter sp.]